jgi:hypothetical protein
MIVKGAAGDVVPIPTLPDVGKVFWAEAKLTTAKDEMSRSFFMAFMLIMISYFTWL